VILTNLNAEDLMAFETDVAERFNAGKIRAPVHLNFGCEDALIEVFKDVQEEDWVFCSWRSHYQCLLKGVPPAEVMSEIMAGRSIALCFPEHRIYSSAIVGGILPIAVGVALGIKRQKSSERVWCFIGDMTAEMGMANTSIKYSLGHDLPIIFVVEDNSVSVMTDTKEVWGRSDSSFARSRPANVRYFRYQSKYPHAGAGQRVEF
jgi:pyruvate dehydrogenase E1 component alpha subunit